MTIIMEGKSLRVEPNIVSRETQKRKDPSLEDIVKKERRHVDRVSLAQAARIAFLSERPVLTFSLSYTFRRNSFCWSPAFREQAALADGV